jgi:hypothetical protein
MTRGEVRSASMKMLNEQLSGVHSSLLVCKWPVTLTSSVFITLLCWEMAGDNGGWFRAIWVPIVGFGSVMILMIWDRAVIAGFVNFDTADTSKSVELLVLHKLGSNPSFESSVSGANG